MSALRRWILPVGITASIACPTYRPASCADGSSSDLITSPCPPTATETSAKVVVRSDGGIPVPEASVLITLLDSSFVLAMAGTPTKTTFSGATDANGEYLVTRV